MHILKIFLLAICLQSCAITPTINLTYKNGIDFRYDRWYTIKQKFYTSNPSLGSYSIFGFNYNF